MQTTGGTISILDATPNVVTVSGAYNWEQVRENLSWLIIAGSVFQITGISGGNTIEISPEYPTAGSNFSTDAYTIVNDFTGSHQLPLLNPGDMEAASIFSRAMTSIDGKLGGVGATPINTDVTITVAHDFVIGNAITFNGSNWVRCAADSAANAKVIGIVIAGTETSSTQFTFRTQGQVTGITGFSGVAGSILYLKNSSSTPNLTTTPPTLKVPLLLMVSNTAGYIMTLAVNEAGVFSSGTNGLVPAPGASTGFLTHLGTWAGSSVVDHSLLMQHMVVGDPNTDVNWTNFDAGVDAVKIPAHISQLNDRLSVVEANSGVVAYSRTMYSRLSGGTVSNTWSGGVGGTLSSDKMPTGYKHSVVVPTSVTEFVLTVCQGSPKYLVDSDYDFDAYVFKCRLTVVPGTLVEIFIARANASNEQTAKGAHSVIVMNNGLEVLNTGGCWIYKEVSTRAVSSGLRRDNTYTYVGSPAEGVNSFVWRAIPFEELRKLVCSTPLLVSTRQSALLATTGYHYSGDSFNKTAEAFSGFAVVEYGSGAVVGGI